MHIVPRLFHAYLLLPLFPFISAFCSCSQSLVCHVPSQLPFYHVSPSSPVCPILCLSFSRINSHTFLTPSQDRHNHRFCSTVISACVLAGEDPRHCCCLLLPPKPIWRCGRPGDETPGTPLSCFYCASSSRHDIKRVAIPVYFKRYL